MLGCYFGSNCSYSVWHKSKCFFSLVFRLLNLSFVLSEFALFYVSFSSAPLWFPLCFEKKAKQQIVAFVDLLSPFLVR